MDLPGNNHFSITKEQAIRNQMELADRLIKEGNLAGAAVAMDHVQRIRAYTPPAFVGQMKPIVGRRGPIMTDIEYSKQDSGFDEHILFGGCSFGSQGPICKLC